MITSIKIILVILVTSILLLLADSLPANKLQYTTERDITTPTVPSAPQNLTVRHVTSYQINLTWVEPSGAYRSLHLPKHHEHRGDPLPLRTFNQDSEFTENKMELDRLVSEAEESVWKFFARRRRRREMTTTDSPTTKSEIEIVPDGSGTGEIPTEKNAISDEDEYNIKDEPIEEQHIFYVLYYEKGYSGGKIHGKSFPEVSEKKIANISLVYLGHKAGGKEPKRVKYSLTELDPYTYYRIYVKAYYGTSSTLPQDSDLGPASHPVIALTDVSPPSAPVFKSLTCDQPPGTLHISWSRPIEYPHGLDAYILTMHRLSTDGRSGSVQQVQLDTKPEHIETSISLVVDIINNITRYEIKLQAATKSIINSDLLINGTQNSSSIIMTRDCIPLNNNKIGQGAGLGSAPDEEVFTRPEIGHLVGFLFAGGAALLILLPIYKWGCSRSAFKKCFPVSYLFLDEGCNIVANEGFIDCSTPGKSAVQEVSSKKATSPTHATIFSWDTSENSAISAVDEQLYDSTHPPVPVDIFLAHTAALHADGDIGFSKEYELIQTKSAMLGHTSHHSQHPENRHKNRYLNITAYDHSRVCLLPSSSCSCDSKEHKKSCIVKQTQESPPHFDYVNANFIDGIVNNIDSELATFITVQNNKRKQAQKLKEERMNKSTESQKSLLLEPRSIPFSSLEPKLPDGFNMVDGKHPFAQFEPKLPLNQNIIKDNMSLDFNTEKKAVTPGSEILANTCRLSINLDKLSNNEDTKSEKSIKESKSKKRSTSADTKDIVLDKKCGSKGHSKNSSVVVGHDSSPPNGAPKIEGAFLNIEFSGIVDSEIELQKAKEAERLEEVNRLSKEAVEETLDDLDDLYVKIGGESLRVKSSWLLDRRRYIGTQGPTPGTLPAFWRMVWDHDVTVIVMITNLIERGRRKCDMYWPKEGTESYGAIQVTILNEDAMATYTVRTFQIRNTKSGINRSVLQYHYTVWPDHGTPEHPLAVLRFREAARKINQQQSGTILVHCSAGVGRTGTYIVLDAMLNHLKLTGSLNVFGFLCHVRTQRNFLVQTEEQYVFIHDALLEAIQSGDTEVPPEKSKEYLKTLLEPLPDGIIQDTPSYKCGMYGTILPEPISVDTKNNESDFAMWDNKPTCEMAEKNLEAVLKSICPVNGHSSVCNGINGNELNVATNTLNNIDVFKTSSENCDDIYGDDVVLRVDSPKSSPEKILLSNNHENMDNQFNDSSIKIKSNINNSDCNDDALSDMNSTNGFNTECEDNNMYENYNGNSIKEESKSNSLCNGDSPDKADCNNQDESVVSVIENTYSSISTECNNSIRNTLSQAENDTPNSKIKNRDINERNFKVHNDNSYELLNSRGLKEGSADGYFSDSHRFAFQKKDNKKKARNLLEHQFKLITSFEPSKYHMVSAYKQVNINKNRHGAVLPIESGRVHLMPKPGVEGSDYINATWLQGHRSLREYIITQHPLLDTVDDLYRMLWDTSSQLLVCLTDCDEDQECQSFWPTEEEQEINVFNFNIRFISQEKFYAKRKSKSNCESPISFKTSNISPLQSPNSGSSMKGFSMKLNKASPKITPITLSNEEIGKELNNGIPSRVDDSHNISFYRRQSSIDNQDEERLIPKSEDIPSLDNSDDIDESREVSELRKLNSETKSDGFSFDKSDLRIEVSQNIEPASPTEPKSAKLMKRPNGEAFSPNEDKKSHCKSPSKISLKSLKISSPILKSPTKFKFDFGARISINSKTESDQCKSPPPQPQLVSNVSLKPKFEIIPFQDVTQLRTDACEEISKDSIITTTHISMSSTQDDYELRIKLIECPKWLTDLDYDENSDTDEDSEDEEYEMETKALDFVIEQRLKAYKSVFGLPEYLLQCQDDNKNSPVVIVDKNGGARATALCTLCGVLRQQSRDIYSFAKLHHGRRAGTWRRPADLRALYESLAAYESPTLVQHL